MNNTLQAFAQALQEARRGGAPATAPTGLTLADAYRVAEHNHQQRLRLGERAVGRKIGHTNPANWPAQGIEGPSWGWLYDGTTWLSPAESPAPPWREPKVELELVVRLGSTPGDAPAVSEQHGGDRAHEAAWAGCIEAVAVGFEFVDRPYAEWGGTVAESVAAGGVHAGLLVGPWQPWPANGALACRQLVASLTVNSSTWHGNTWHGNTRHGGSAGVMGSPLRALAALQATLKAQQAAPLKAGECITTGALVAAMPWRPGESITGQISDGADLNLRLHFSP